MMKVLKKSPGQPAEEIEIENTLKALQQEVGGYIETVTVAEDCTIICDEEGRLKNKPFNCRLCGVNFVGDILVVGVDGEEFCDVPDEATELFLNKFYFTFGTGGAYRGGWVIAFAENRAEAYRLFEERFPKLSNGCLNFCNCYTEDEFMKSDMYRYGNLGARCHEEIRKAPTEAATSDVSANLVNQVKDTSSGEDCQEAGV